MSDNDSSERSDDILAAEYVLGVLSREERSAFSKRLEQDSNLRDRVRFWNEQLAPMANEVDPVTPPPGTYVAIEGRLFPAAQPAAGWWSSLRLWRGLAIVSMAALVVAGLVLFSVTGQQNPDGRTYVAQIAGDAGAVQLVAYIDTDKGSLTLSRTEGTPVQGRDFELWLIEDGNDPVSLGVLPVDRVATLAVPDTYRTRLSGAVLAISDEPLGGSPTGQPTGAVLATGTVVEI